MVCPRSHWYLGHIKHSHCRLLQNQRCLAVQYHYATRLYELKHINTVNHFLNALYLTDIDITADIVNVNRPVIISSRLPNIPPTIPIANYLVSFRLHQPEVAISGIFGRDNHPKLFWNSLQNTPLFGKISRYLSGATSPAQRLALCANAEQNISS